MSLIYRSQFEFEFASESESEFEFESGPSKRLSLSRAESSPRVRSLVARNKLRPSVS